MKTVTFSQLRNNAKKYFDAVERGESVEVYRHGKPVALISPAGEKIVGSRRNLFEPIRIPGVSGSKLIIEERKRSRF
jgi:prevent-host-death family protein